VLTHCPTPCVLGSDADRGFGFGNAHGLELPVAASAPGYAAGFILASILCLWVASRLASP
jgi:hydrogenase/urease accessory protein HupE